MDTGKKSNEQLMAEMDSAAVLAKAEILDVLQRDQPSADDVITWFAANYMRAGHKRLGRILVAISKERGGV